MCGILFYRSRTETLNHFAFEKALDSILWRGPDAKKIYFDDLNNTLIGHVRLSIIDVDSRSDQPLFSEDNNWCIIFNGEIYNHEELRLKHNLNCKTRSDTETVLVGFLKYGYEFLKELDGMFAIVIYNILSGDYYAARDPFGIKPLFIYDRHGSLIISSETKAINKIIKSTISEESIFEWRLLRRPMLGCTFYNEIDEFTPGLIVKNGRKIDLINPFVISTDDFEQEKFEYLLSDCIRSHELSDVPVVSLVSGGLDSGIITILANVRRAYTIGYFDNNEVSGAIENCVIANKELVCNLISPSEIASLWNHLIKLKGEPLYVPNEAFIFKICSLFSKEEKVVLTGEGADELLFGYDRLFRIASLNKFKDVNDFLENYGYSDIYNCTERLRTYLESKWNFDKQIDFVEDFFYEFHLTCLLRRMDFSSMAASKESRVPFVSKRLIQYMYRRPHNLKINAIESKAPIRKLAFKLGMHKALDVKKIGFSATINNKSKKSEYFDFQNFNMRTLGWL